LEVVQNAHDYPITPKEHGTEFLMDNRHLWIRSKKQHAVLKVRHTVIKACAIILTSNGFILADTPIFTPAACEGTTTLFEVDYFGDDKAYLTQSGQLYNEATAAAFGKSYAFGPTFRAEKSKTRRHLTEFWMVEPEVAYANLEDMMDLGEGLILASSNACLTNAAKNLKHSEARHFEIRSDRLARFPRVHYDEAVKILQEGFDKGELENNFEWGGDFGAPDETIFQINSAPVFVHHFPAAIKGFILNATKNAPNSRLGIDLLAPEGYGEIIGGGERAIRISNLSKNKSKNTICRANPSNGISISDASARSARRLRNGHRTLHAWMCGIEHVRETIPFPRMLYRSGLHIWTVSELIKDGMQAL
jgi:asparaginyl-tRNA synthetase